MKQDDEFVKKIGKRLTVPEQALLAVICATSDIFDLTFGEIAEALLNVILFIIEELDERMEHEASEISEMLKQAEEVLKDA